MDWTIRPLWIGTLHRKRSSFLYAGGSSDPLDVPVTAFLLEKGDTRVLVDTGCDDPLTAYDDHHPFERPPEQHLLARLDALGVDPKSIGLVILSHLHWDHSYGLDLLPEARFVVQGSELRYASAPLPWHARSYDSFVVGRTPPWARTPWDVIDGDRELMPGLGVLLSPGHTPGMQTVTVQAATGLYVLPSDNVPLYENWEGRPPTWPHIPDTHHYSLADYYETFLQLERLGGRLLPPHDFRIFDREVYR